MTYFKILLLPTAVLLFISMLFKSCAETEADTSPSKPYIVDLTAADYAFAMPSEIKSGWVTFRFNNIGKEVHYANILKISNDISQAEWESSYDAPNQTSEDYFEIWGGFSFLGGPGFHSSGANSEVTIYLEPGSYEMFCEIETEQGVDHRFLGMRKFFKVTEEKTSAGQPVADMTFRLKSFYIEAEGALSSGKQTVAIQHAGEMLDLHLVQLNDTSTMERAMNFMNDLEEPTQSRFLTGAEGFAEEVFREQTSYVTLDLKPGNYAWMSQEFSGVGMYKKFTVTKDKVFDFRPAGKVKKIDLTLSADAIQVPEIIGTGMNEFAVNTTDFDSNPDEHRIVIFRLKEGKTINNFKEYIANRDSGGKRLPNPMIGLDAPINYSEEKSGLLKLNLRKGSYGVACTDWRWEHQSKHIEKGEVASFEVK